MSASDCDLGQKYIINAIAPNYPDLEIETTALLTLIGSLTRYQKVPEKLHYTPNLRLGSSIDPGCVLLSSNMHIKDRTFIISGGSSGLGLATVRDLHEHGGYVAIVDINEQAGNKAVTDLGDHVKFWKTDIMDSSSIESAVKGIAEWVKQTGKPIGAVIPAAGVGNPAKLITKKNEPVPMKQLDFVLNINLRGVLDLVRQVLPHMTVNEPSGDDGERGVIVLVSSSAAFDGQPGQVAYAASKGAIRSMTLVLARDLAQNGIRCMAVAPSFFESPMTAQLSDTVRKSLEKVFEFPKRPGQAKEFASCVRFCIENQMLNGEVIRLDGATRMPSRL